MKRALIGWLAALTAVAVPASAETWNLDGSHSSAQFSVRHMMVANVRGEFSRMSGVLELDPAEATRSRVEVTIEAASIYTREARRDAHLKGPDFLDVANFPNLTFRSRRAAPRAGGGLDLTGDLTIRGVTREVVFEVEGPTAPVKDPMGNLRIGASARTRISRREFGLVYNRLLEGGGAVVGDEVTITVDLEFRRPAAGGPAPGGVTR